MKAPAASAPSASFACTGSTGAPRWRPVRRGDRRQLGPSGRVVRDLRRLADVDYICDTVIVLYLGRIMEIAPSAELHASPRRACTRALLSAIPSPVPRRASQRRILMGDIPSPSTPPSGCVFHTRCPHAIEACARVVPPLEDVGAGHRSAFIRNHALQTVETIPA